MKRALLLVGVCVHFIAAGSPALADPAESVVKVTAFTRFPNPIRPWEKPAPIEILMRFVLMVFSPDAATMSSRPLE